MNRWKLLALLALGHAFEHWYQGTMSPIFPFLAKDIGLSFTEIGLLLAGRSVMAGLSSAATGFAIDILGGGKWMLVFCLAGIAAALGGVSLSPSFFVLAPIYWSIGIATHTWHPPAMGLLGERFSGQKGFSFGIHGAGSNIGMMLSPLVAGHLLLLLSWRSVLQVTMIPLLLVALLLAVALPPFRLGESRKGEEPAVSFREIREILPRNPGLIAASVFSGLRTAIHSGVIVFVPFLLTQRFDSGPRWVGASIAAFSAASVIAEMIVGHISDRIPRKTVLLVGLTAGGLLLLAVPAAPSGAVLLVLLVLIGTFWMSLRSVIFAYSLDIAPPRLAGSAVGVIFTTNQIFSSLIPLAAGVLSDRYGPASAFWFFGIVVLLGGVLFPFMPAPSEDAPGTTAEVRSAHPSS